MEKATVRPNRRSEAAREEAPWRHPKMEARAVVLNSQGSPFQKLQLHATELCTANRSSPCLADSGERVVLSAGIMTQSGH